MSASRIALISSPAVVMSVLAAALTGCSPSSSGAASGTGTGGGSASAAGASTAAAATLSPAAASTAAATTAAAALTQGKLDGGPKACPPAGEAMSSLHLSQLVLHGDDPAFCQYFYQGDSAAPYVSITFNAAPPGYTPAAFENDLKHAQSDVQAAPGVGADAAFTWGGKTGSGLSLLSAGTICSIVTIVPTTAAGKIALAKAILAG